MVEFQYQGMSFPVSEEVGNYAAVRLENLVIREKVRDAFLEMYHGYHSMDTAMERMPDDLHGLLYKVINMLANRWIEQPIFLFGIITCRYIMGTVLQSIPFMTRLWMHIVILS